MRAITLLLAALPLAGGCDLFASDARDIEASGAADAGPAQVDPSAECPIYQGGGTVCVGSYEVRNQGDVEEIADCARITGDLELGANGLVEIALPLLERVDGTVAIHDSFSLERILLPELKEIGLDLESRGLALPVFVELAVPRLRTIDGGMYVSPMAPMADWSLPCLDSIGDFAVFAVPTTAPSLISIGGELNGPLDAPLLESVGGELFYTGDQNLPSLRLVGGLSLYSTTGLALPELRTITGKATFCFFGGETPSFDTLSLPQLRRAGAMSLCPWPALTTVDLPRLQAITGPMGVGGLDIGAGAGLTSVELPALTAINGPGTFAVAADLSVLASAGDLTVQASVTVPALTTSRSLLLYVAFDAPSLATVVGNVTTYDAIDLPSLATVSGDMNLYSTSGTLVFPALTSVGGHVLAFQTQAPELRAPLLTSIGSPSSSGYLRIESNPVLANIEFPSLTSLAKSLLIRYNPQLPNCQALALRDQLIAAGWTGVRRIFGNGTGTCP